MLPHGEVGCTRNKRFWVLFQDRTYSHERKRCCCLQQREIIFTITYAGICVCIFSEAFIYIVLLPCFPTPKSPPSSNVICYSPFRIDAEESCNLPIGFFDQSLRLRYLCKCCASSSRMALTFLYLQNCAKR